MPGAAPLPHTEPIHLQLRPVLDMNADEFFAVCQLNRDLRLERTAKGDLVIMAPAGGETGNRNARLTAFLTLWALHDGSGEPFDSSTGFILPNGAIRSPDAAWVKRSRLATLTPEQKKKFLPLCPDFLIELRSPSDSLEAIQEKMQEYVANGARLGWLLDPPERRVFVYRPRAAVECVENPPAISGDPELPGFILDLARIWAANF